MGLVKLWTGKAYGTHTGNLFIKLNDGNDDALTGVLHFNDHDVLSIYEISGSFDGKKLSLNGKPQSKIEGYDFGSLTVTGLLNSKGEFSGEWKTSIGSAGTFVIFPNDQYLAPEIIGDNTPEQLHTVRHSFGAIRIDHEQFLSLADSIQSDFKIGKVVVTVVTSTEKTHYLEYFRGISLDTDRINIVKIFVQEPDSGGLNKTISIELGPQSNIAIVQGGNEAWVLGILEKIKKRLKLLEQFYITKFNKFGFGINQLFLISAIIYLPSLSSLMDRVILVGVVLVLIFIINRFHYKYLPHAVIRFDKNNPGNLKKYFPVTISWIFTILSAIISIFIATRIEDFFNIIK